MNQQLQPVYQDFEPTTDCSKNDADFHTFLLYLPGFRKEQLKVQVTSAGNLRVTGERPIVGENRISRFRHEVSISSSSYDVNGITAKFEGGVLRIKLPKIKPHGSDQPDEQVPQQKHQTESGPNPEKPDPKVLATDDPGKGSLEDEKTTTAPQACEAEKQETSAVGGSIPAASLNCRELFDGLVTKLKIISGRESAGIVMTACLMGLVMGVCLEKAVRLF